MRLIFHDAFDPEFDVLDLEVQIQLMAAARALERLGPAADRPHVGTLNNPRHPNMKELRFDTHLNTVKQRAASTARPGKQ